MKKIFAILLALLMLTAAFAGCAEDDKPQGSNSDGTGGIFRDYMTAPLTNLNGQVTTDVNAFLNLCGTTLYKDYLNENKSGYSTEPMLAADVPQKMNDEGTVWNIPIRRDYYWPEKGNTNGEQMNADTVVYTFKMLLDPTLLNLTASNFVSHTRMQVKNAARYQQQVALGEPVAWEEVGIKKVDEFTVQITTEEPTNAEDVMDVMGGTTYGTMLYEPLFERWLAPDRSATLYGTDLEHFATSGWFVLTQWIPDAKFVLEKNESFVEADRIKIDGIEYTVVPDSNTALELFLQDKLDRAGLVYSQWANYEDDPRVYEYYNDSVTYLFINNGNPKCGGLLKNLNMRKAIYYAFDRQEFADVLDGAPFTRLYRRCVLADKEKAVSILDVPVDWADTPEQAFDLKKSAEFLIKAYEECGVQSGEFEIYYNESGTHTRASTEITQRQLSTNLDGIDIKIRAVPQAQAYTLRRWNKEDPDAYDFNIGSVLPSDNPIDTMKFWAPETGRQFCWDEMPEEAARFTALYNSALTAVQQGNTAEEVRLCLEMEKMIAKEIYVRVPVYELTTKVLYAERVHLPANGYIPGVGFAEQFMTLDR